MASGESNNPSTRSLFLPLERTRMAELPTPILAVIIGRLPYPPLVFLPLSSLFSLLSESFSRAKHCSEGRSNTGYDKRLNIYEFFKFDINIIYPILLFIRNLAKTRKISKRKAIINSNVSHSNLIKKLLLICQQT